jgi:hypothetical protein
LEVDSPLLEFDGNVSVDLVVDHLLGLFLLAISPHVGFGGLETLVNGFLALLLVLLS